MILDVFGFSFIHHDGIRARLNGMEISDGFPRLEGVH